MLELDETIEGRIAGALGTPPGEAVWYCGQVEPLRLRLEGCDGARRLRLWAEVTLVGRSPEKLKRFRAVVVSDPWVHPESAPAWHTPVTLDPVASFNVTSSNVASSNDAELAYRVVDLDGQAGAAAGSSFWRRYLEPAAGAPAVDEKAETAERALLRGLSRWLADDLGATTVAGALQCLAAGPVGAFGPLQTVVLERSGQADLEFDGTLVAELEETAGDSEEVAKTLALYREREGAWVLHRRELEPRRRKRAGDGQAHARCEVLVAEEAEALVLAAGLAPLEKRLFQQAGLLQHERLSAAGSRSAEGVAEPDATAAALVMDLAAVPERSRRYLRALYELALTGRLTPPQLDHLLRTARLFSRDR